MPRDTARWLLNPLTILSHSLGKWKRGGVVAEPIGAPHTCPGGRSKQGAHQQGHLRNTLHGHPYRKWRAKEWGRRLACRVGTGGR
jgi:hypothetical protein